MRRGIRRSVMAVAGLLAAIAITAGSCTGPRVWNCPTSIPGAQGQPPIPVIKVADDGGQKLTDAQVANNSGPEVACETDANRNNIGDEYETEVAENALNGVEE